MFGMGQMPGHMSMGQTGYQTGYHQQQSQAGMMTMQPLMQPLMQSQMGMGVPFSPMNFGYNSMANGPVHNTGYGMGPMGF